MTTGLVSARAAAVATGYVSLRKRLMLSARIGITSTKMKTAIADLPAELVRTITWDQGREMARHVDFSVDTGVQVYFCDPHSPWQRGSNENTNGLVRQYLPRETNFSRISQAHLNAIALRLNQRPRKTLGFETPADKLQAVLH